MVSKSSGGHYSCSKLLMLVRGGYCIIISHSKVAVVLKSFVEIAVTWFSEFLVLGHWPLKLRVSRAN